MGIIRYVAGVLDWTKEKLKSIDIKTRKLMTMNGSISCEKCVNVEVQNLNKYLSESEEWMLKFVAG